MSKKNRTSRQERRDYTQIANQRLPLLNNYVSRLKPVTSLSLYEDRRLWHPEGPYAPARSFSQTRHRLRQGHISRARPSSQSHRSSKSLLRGLQSNVGHVVSFHRPQRVLLCVRRKMRREVLHALNKAGRRGQRRPKFNSYSSISCRR